MPRQSFTDLLARVPETATSTSNQEILRKYWDIWAVNFLRDLADTLKPAYGVMLIETPETISLSETPITLTAWDAAPIITPEFTADPVTGIITVNIPMVVEFTISYTLELGNAEEHIATIDRVGAPGPSFYTGSVQGRGSGRPVGINIPAYFDVTAAGEQFEVMVANESGTTNVTFQTGAFIARYIPLINTPP